MSEIVLRSTEKLLRLFGHGIAVLSAANEELERISQLALAEDARDEPRMHVRSPILLLETAIAASAFTIAPERAEELKALDERHGFTLVPTDETGFEIRINGMTHEVKLPIATLEYLWACSYLLHAMYQEYVDVQRSRGTQLDLARAPKCAEAIELLNWSIDNMMHSGVRPWPTNKPMPKVGPAEKGDIQIANELFLVAVGWLIHHEISHVVLDHKPVHKVFSKQKEKEADLKATDWIVSSSRVDLETQKRSLGIVAALLSMQFLDSPARSDTYTRSHPPTVERLDYCLTRAKASDDGAVCALATVGLQFHLSQFGITAALDGTSIRDVLAGFMIAFARHAGS
jgi:hypothetical protein